MHFIFLSPVFLEIRGKTAVSELRNNSGSTQEPLRTVSKNSHNGCVLFGIFLARRSQERRKHEVEKEDVGKEYVGALRPFTVDLRACSLRCKQGRTALRRSSSFSMFSFPASISRQRAYPPRYDF
jgi:hypothetical protein